MLPKEGTRKKKQSLGLDTKSWLTDDSFMIIMRPSHKQHVGLLQDDVSRSPKLSKSLSCVVSLDSAQPLSSYYIVALAPRLCPFTRTSDVAIPRHMAP